MAVDLKTIFAGPVQSGKRFIDLMSDWFPPGQPVAPQAPAGTQLRERDYPVGYNIVVQPRAEEEISFQTLRDLARFWWLLNTVIETRKDQIAAVRWSVKPKLLPGESQLDYKTRAADVAGIDQVTSWLERPDGRLAWHPWLRKLAHDRLILDAVAIFPRRSQGRVMLDLVQGETIKILIDSEGRLPAPPSKAYQQYLKGLPALDFTTDELRYYMRTPRSDHIYGYPPVEQIIDIVNLALRRMVYKTSYYTEGNLPEAIIQLPENWPIDKIRQFSEWWNSVLAGQVDQRRKAFFIPTIGGDKAISYPKQDAIKDEMDDFLSRAICFTFSVSPQALVAMMNRATAQTAAEAAKAEGLQPELDYVKSIMDDAISYAFERPDLEFAWQEDVEPDLLKRAQIQEIKIKAAINTPNEIRAENGDDPVEGGDELGTITAQGFVPISISSQPPPAPVIQPGGNGNGNGKKPSAKDDAQKVRGRAVQAFHSERAKRILASTTRLTSRYLARQGQEAAKQLAASFQAHALLPPPKSKKEK
jgi:portal protein